MSETVAGPSQAGPIAFPVLGAISLCHLLNDMMQSLLPAIYPILKGGFDLGFAEIGLLTLTYQITASLLQPLVGFYTDRHPQPYSLPVGMGASLIGLVLLAFAPSYGVLLAGGAMLGLGSSVFHPESSRIARLASGGSHGLPLMRLRWIASSSRPLAASRLSSEAKRVSMPPGWPLPPPPAKWIPGLSSRRSMHPAPTTRSTTRWIPWLRWQRSIPATQSSTWPARTPF